MVEYYHEYWDEVKPAIIANLERCAGRNAQVVVVRAQAVPVGASGASPQKKGGAAREEPEEEKKEGPWAAKEEEKEKKEEEEKGAGAEAEKPLAK
eukprot:2681443-Rhodomonas_salina.1